MLHKEINARRSISIAIALMLLITSVIACAGSVSAASRLKVKAGSSKIYVGKTTTLKASANVKWSVSNKKIAKLTKTGKRTVRVRGLKPGKVYIIAKSGGKTVKTRIVVKSDAPSKINLKSSHESIGMGEYCSVVVKSVKPSGANSDVVFSSSDKTIATVDSKGLVMGLSPGTVTITARSAADKSVKSSVELRVLAARSGTLKLDVDLTDESRYPAGKTAKVWLPVPQSDDFQYISAVRYDAPGAKTAELTYDSDGGKQLYIEWDENTAPADRKAALYFHLYRRASVYDDSIPSKEKGTVDKTRFAEYMKETQWSGSLTSGIVKETADKIVSDAKAETVYDKAHAIYEWVCDNITRIDDKNVIFGDVVSILSGSRLAGSCMDVNSVFTALCRAEGIPARNLFGMRFAPKCGMNCRAECYIPGYGWASADPALAIKQSWGHEDEYIGSGAVNSAVWQGIKDKYWINAEENWICNNSGRDITLTPPQSAGTGEYHDVINPDGTLNIYMFPYGEFGGEYIPCRDAANFKYEYSFEEEDPTDCGC